MFVVLIYSVRDAVSAATMTGFTTRVPRVKNSRNRLNWLGQPWSGAQCLSPSVDKIRGLTNLQRFDWLNLLVIFSVALR
jgi:hypothetical protein